MKPSEDHQPSTSPNKTGAAVSSEELVEIIDKAGRGQRSGKWFLVILSLLLSAGGWWVFNARSQDAPKGPSFVTEPLKKGDLSLRITVTGNLEPTNEVTVGSELSGIVVEVFVDTNDHVTIGQPLARLDTSKLEAQLESNRASLNSTKARVAQAKATLKESQAALARLESLEKLSEGRAVSKADLDAAVATKERAEADVLSAEAAVGEAEAQGRIIQRDLEKAVIKSPIDGIVLTRNVEPGQTVAASFTAPELFVIAEKLEHMKLLVTVAEADIGHVKADQEATFTVDAWPDRVYQAKVTKVAFGSTLTDNVVTYEAELVVNNDDLSLRPGMTATAEIKAEEVKDAFLVSHEALRFDPGASAPRMSQGPPQKKSFIQKIMPGPPRRPMMPKGNDVPKSVAKAGNYRVWVLRDGKPEPVPVNLGIKDEGLTAITGKDLQEGMAIILRADALLLGR